MIYFFKPQQGAIVWETQAPVDFLNQNDGKKCYCEMGRETGVRTLPQNDALHLGFSFIAKELNERGADMRTVLKPDVDIPWETKTVKKYLFVPIIKAMYGKEHTSDLEKLEISPAWDVMMKYLGENPACHLEYLPFPSEQTKP